MTSPRSLLPPRLHAFWDHQGIAWRRLAYLGSRFGPRPWVKHSPTGFAVAFALVLTREREAIRRNLRRLFGPRPRLVEERDIHRTFIAYAHCLAESLGSEREDATRTQCHVRGQDILDDVLRQPTGFIIGTAHTGGWDIAAQYLMAQTGRRVVLVMDREPDPQARQLQDALRAKRGVEVVHVGADALEGLALLRHLKQGGVVAVQMDRVAAPSRTVEVRLGQSSFHVPLGPFVLASLSQVPLIPMFVARRGYFDYSVQIEQPIRVPRRRSGAEIDAVAQRVASYLEEFLRAHPEQWFNFVDADDLVRPGTT